MFAAILSATLMFLLVIAFILLLHSYARCILSTRDPATSEGAPPVLGSQFHHLRNLFTANSDDNHNHSTPPTNKGLVSSVISTIPQFVFKENQQKGEGLECVICLSIFEDKEVGRKLTLCDHAFHTECIDMWLHSHTTCPICRAPAVKQSFLVYSAPQRHEISTEDPSSWQNIV